MLAEQPFTEQTTAMEGPIRKVIHLSNQRPFLFMNSLRSFFSRSIPLALLVCFLSGGQGLAQSNLVADGFDPKVQGEVLVVVEQSDGKVLIGGDFTRVGSVNKRYLARLNLDGSLDTAFNPVLNGTVRALAIQADGKAVVGGDFTLVNGVARNYLARLNVGGALDAGFTVNVVDSCRALLIQPDERIIAGGVGYLKRLLPTGALDLGFVAPDVAGRRIHTLALQPDNMILAGGNIEQPRRGLMRLNPNGSLDASYLSELDAPVHAVKILADGRVIVGGEFANASNLPTPFIARLELTGARDPDFLPSLAMFGMGATEDGGPGAVRTLELLSDGGVLAGGDVAFAAVDGNSRFWMAKINESGIVEGSLNVNANAVVNRTLMRSDGRVVVVGRFGSIGGKARLGVARLVSPIPVSEVNLSVAAVTVGEKDGSVTIDVNLDMALEVPFSVPITFGGTAKAGQDYVRPASPLRFQPGEVSKALVITIIDDDLIEPDETILVNLGVPSDPAVARGSMSSAVVTIESDDIAPEIQQDPDSQIVAVGQAVDLSAVATGVPDPRLQWRKNGRNIAGATTDTLSLAAVGLGDAGTYTMRATVGVTSGLTQAAQLTVVDQQPTQVVAATTANVTLRARVSTRDTVSYQWFRNGVSMSDALPTVRGTGTPNLTLRNLALADATVYHCQVTSSAGPLNSGEVTLVVYDAPPAMNVAVQPLVLPTAMISEDYTFIQPIDPDPTKTPTRFVIRGLPRGLTFDRTTGLIRGRPLVAGTFDRIMITPSNAKGAGPSVAAVLEVVDLPAGTVGSYVGLIGKNPVVNGNLGGVLTMSVTRTGVVSGSIRAGAEVRPFRTVLDTLAAGGDPTLSATVRRLGGRPSFQLELTVRPATSGLEGSVGVDGFMDLADVDGHACLPAGPERLGRHTVTLELADNNDVGVEAIPQGVGFLSFVVAPRGNLRVTGRTADGAPVTSVTHLGPMGEVYVFGLQHRNTGSLHGLMTMAADSTHTLGGTLRWEKGLQANLRERNYRLGFGPLELQVLGGLYERPADNSQPVMGLPLTEGNAKLTFTEGGVSSAVVSPDIIFTLTNRVAGAMPTVASGNNPNRVTCQVNRNTGLISGRFVLNNQVPSGRNLPRVVIFQGVVAFDGTGLTGGGYFLLPKLPATAEELPAGTDILSGALLLSAP